MNDKHTAIWSEWKTIPRKKKSVTCTFLGTAFALFFLFYRFDIIHKEAEQC